MTSKLKRNIPAIILFVFFLSLYIYTAAPGVYDGDSGELAAAVNTLGLAHPTGFPLYILTAKVFTFLLPVGDVAFKLNIFSAILTAMAVLIFFLGLLKLHISKIAAFISSFMLGLGNSIWSNAGAARVYPLSFLIVSLLLLWFVEWLDTKNKKYITYYAITLGIGLGSHPLLIIMVLPLLFIILSEKSFKSVWLLGFMSPLAQYLYLPWAYARNTIINFGEMNTIAGLWHYITQRDYAFKMATRTSRGSIELVNTIIHLAISEFTILFFIVSIVGFIILCKKNMRISFLFFTMVLANVLVLYFYGNDQDIKVIFRYFFVSFLIFAIFIAFAIQLFINKIKHINYVPMRYFILAILLLLPLIILQSNLQNNNRRNNYIIFDYVQNILKTVDPDSIIISEADSITGPLWYLQSTGQKKDAIIIDKQMLGWDWYIRNLNKIHPNIVNLSLLGQETKEERLKKLIADNYGKLHIYVAFFDENFNKQFLNDFEFIPAGVIYKLSKEKTSFQLIKDENEKIWGSYQMRNLSDYHGSFFVEIDVKNYAVALNNLGATYIDNGDLDDAERVLRRALEIHPVIKPIAEHNLDIILQRRQ